MFAASLDFFFCYFLAEAGWVSMTGRRKTTHKNWYAFCTQGEKNIICTWAVIFWASLPRWNSRFLGLVEVQKHHGVIVHWLVSALWSPMGLSRPLRHCCAATEQKEGNLHEMCAPEQARVGWGHPHDTGVSFQLLHLDAVLCWSEKGQLSSVAGRRMRVDPSSAQPTIWALCQADHFGTGQSFPVPRAKSVPRCKGCL